MLYGVLCVSSQEATGRDIAITTIIVMATMVISMEHGVAIIEVSTSYILSTHLLLLAI